MKRFEIAVSSKLNMQSQGTSERRRRKEKKGKASKVPARHEYLYSGENNGTL